MCFGCSKPIERLNSVTKNVFCTACKSKINSIKRKIWAIAYKNGKCNQCGRIAVLPEEIPLFEFHHRDANEKEFEISKASSSISKFKEEIDKCDLLCLECHRKIHILPLVDNLWQTILSEKNPFL